MSDPQRLQPVFTFDAGPGADPEDVEQMGRQLRAELVDLDPGVPRAGDQPPAGATGVDAAPMTEFRRALLVAAWRDEDEGPRGPTAPARAAPLPRPRGRGRQRAAVPPP